MAENTVEDYGWSSAEGPASCNYITPAILDLLSGLGAKRVVDIGAGNGQLCADLLAAGFESVGVEYDERGVEFSRRAYPHIPFYRLGVQDDPGLLLLQEPPFDAAVSSEVVEHLFSPHLLPRFAGALLRPGGHLLVTTPYHGYLKNLALSLADKWDDHHTPLWHGGHIKFWSRRTLTRLLHENGFVVLDFQGVGRLPYLWKSMIVSAKRV